MPITITTQGDDLTLDLLLWRKFGRAGQGLTESTLAMNPGLAARGAVIPVGTIVVLPDAAPPAAPAAAQPVSLFA